MFGAFDADSDGPDWDGDTPIEATANQIAVRIHLHVFALSLLGSQLSFYLLAINYILGFLLYDYLITFDDEVEYIWRRPKSANARWFLLNRYLGLVTKVVSIGYLYSNLSPDVGQFTFDCNNLHTEACANFQRCEIFWYFHFSLVLSVHLVVCFLLSIQVVALHGGSHRIMFGLGSSSISLGSVALWLLFTRKRHPPPIIAPGCFFGTSIAGAHRVAGAWEALFVYYSLLFGFSMAKTWTTRRRRGTKRIVPLIAIIFRDGIIYYATVTLSTLANILTYYLAGPYLRGCLSPFCTSIATSMMTRLLLNLLRVNEDSAESLNSTPNIKASQDVSWPQGLTRVELDTVLSNDLEHRRTISIASGK